MKNQMKQKANAKYLFKQQLDFAASFILGIHSFLIINLKKLFTVISCKYKAKYHQN